jgi:uncharacterized protein (UPF0332 family)
MNQEERQDYVRYRMKRATETLDEAKALLSGGLLHGTVNRVYYSMFYAVSALALQNGFSTSSHSQLRGYFNREFVKTGKISIPLGKSFGFAYDNRTKGDYQDLVEFDQDQVNELIQDAEDFIDAVSALVD